MSETPIEKIDAIVAEFGRKMRVIATERDSWERQWWEKVKESDDWNDKACKEEKRRILAEAERDRLAARVVNLERAALGLARCEDERTGPTGIVRCVRAFHHHDLDHLGEDGIPWFLVFKLPTAAAGATTTLPGPAPRGIENPCERGCGRPGVMAVTLRGGRGAWLCSPCEKEGP